MYYSLLIMTVAGTGIKHMSVCPTAEAGSYALLINNELKIGVFANAIFQQAYNESTSKQVDQTVIECGTKENGMTSGIALLSELLADPRRDVREYSNAGTWLDIAGSVQVDNEPPENVTSIYKYMVQENLFDKAVKITMRLLTAEDLHKGLPEDQYAQTHLSARDAFFDQEYVERNGARTFLRYEARTDKVREGVLGEDHHSATPLLIKGLSYPTIDAAGLAFNIPGYTVFNRLNSGADKWVYWQYKDREPAKCITYILRHKDDPGYYIGQTTLTKQRLHQHIHNLRNESHGTPRLQSLISEKGIEGLYHEIVLEGSESECKAKEQELLDQHWGDPNLLNASKNGKSAISHHVQDPEVEKRRVENLRKAVTQDDYREKHSDTMKAAWSVPGRKEARSGAGNPFAKHVSIHGVVYGSVIDAVRSKAGGLTDWVIRTRLKAGTDPEIFYCDAEGNKVT